jgi:hypothetical protein
MTMRNLPIVLLAASMGAGAAEPPQAVDRYAPAALRERARESEARGEAGTAAILRARAELLAPGKAKAAQDAKEPGARAAEAIPPEPPPPWPLRVEAKKP